MHPTTARALDGPSPLGEAAVEGLLVLGDGGTVSIRPARLSDDEDLWTFFCHLPLSFQERPFLSMMPDLDPRLVSLLCDPSRPRSQTTLLATRALEGRPTIIAAGAYLALDHRTAEVTLAVGETRRMSEIAGALLERLALHAVRQGLLHFVAFALDEDDPYLKVFVGSGFRPNPSPSAGRVRLELVVGGGDPASWRLDLAERLATTASLAPFFAPSSVAVVGASRDPAAIGHRVLEALVAGRFEGPVYPVNPHAKVVRSIRAYASVGEIPDPVDLAVIAVPREIVPEAVDACAARGVKALVVLTAGFAEVGEDGRRLEEALVARVRGHGMRMVGPNCLGIQSTDPNVRLNASFTSLHPPAGRIAMASQSGALGMAVLDLARRLDLGMSSFVSVGNKADVTGNDLLQYWEDDPRTGVVLLYLESFGNPRRFARIARRVSQKKPIVVVKAGRTAAGQRAAGSHTAALAACDLAVEALLCQTGVIRADTLEEMFELAAMLSSQPLPAGRRVGIVSNAGGPAVLCTDACEAGGLVVPALDGQTRERLARFLPSAASTANPVDMIASATPEQYGRAIETVLASEAIDALVVLYIPVERSDLSPVIEAIQQGIASGRRAGGRAKPVLACLLAPEADRRHIRVDLPAGPESVPCYTFPEAPARVLARVARHAEWRRRPPGVVPELGRIDPARARDVVRRALDARNAGWLAADEVRTVLEAFGLPLTPGGVATKADEAAQIARRLGFPVALKLASTRIVHKTEMGAVRLDLADESAVRSAFEEIRSGLEARGETAAFEGAIVQPMVRGAIEVMAGAVHDRLFGPIVAFGLGGIHVEVLGDVRFWVTPLTDVDAREAVRAIRGHRLLEGYRGHPPADVPALEELLLRLSRLVEDLPEISEVDLNPIFALGPGQGCRIADARLWVESAGVSRAAP